MKPSATRWERKPLRYGGTCVTCGRSIAKRETGWHDPVISKVICTTCRPASDANGVAGEQIPARGRGTRVGGTSTLRDSRDKGRDASTWRKGAVGEYLMGVSLHRRLTNGEVILTDRQVPGTQANIDHIVVASSGVWIIDAKKWKGKIVYKAVSPASVVMKLTVAGEDRTDQLEAIYKLVIPVANIIGDHSVPIHPAVVFVEGEWGDRVLPRLLLNKPYKHEDVWVSPPKVLSKVIRKPGPLDTASIQRIGKMLDEALPFR